MGQTNVYHPFPDSKAIWRVDETDSSYPFGVGPVYCHYKIYIDGDTIASNGQSYHKLTIEGDFEINIFGHHSSKYLFGYLWQDTLARKIYYSYDLINTCTNCDSLLYDFNMNLGDTLYSNAYFRQLSEPRIVYSVDSILINDLL